MVTLLAHLPAFFTVGRRHQTFLSFLDSYIGLFPRTLALSRHGHRLFFFLAPSSPALPIGSIRLERQDSLSIKHVVLSRVTNRAAFFLFFPFPLPLMQQRPFLESRLVPPSRFNRDSFLHLIRHKVREEWSYTPLIRTEGVPLPAQFHFPVDGLTSPPPSRAVVPFRISY